MKTKVKHICAFTLAALLAFSCLLFPAAVSTDDLVSTYSLKLDLSDVSDDFMVISSGSSDYSQDFLNAAADIAEAALNFEEKIYISDYNLKSSDVLSLFSYVRYEYPELINISNSFSYGRYQNGIVTYVSPHYIFGKSERDKYFTPFYNVIDKVTAQAETLNSDFLKALFVHDYLVKNSRYATEIFDPSFDSKSIEGQFVYNAYGNLVNGFSVCQGYSFAYKAIMDRLFIDVDYVISDEMNHVWNTVTIDGNTYHTDVTFDDPTPDVIGRVYHTNFLCTDDEITAEDHYSWTTTEDISTQSYPTRFWDNVKSQICISGDDMYYTESDEAVNAKLVKRSAASNKAQVIPSTLSNTYWRVMDGMAYYPGSYSRIEMLYDTLYYSMPGGVNSISVDGSNDKTVYTLPESAQGRIYGFVLRNGKFYGEISKTPNESGEIVELDISHIEDITEPSTDRPTEEPTEPVTDAPTDKPTETPTETPTEPEVNIGDVDGNGKITVADAVMIQKHIANIVTLGEKECKLADTDGNGKLTVADAVMIQKYIANIISGF